jgi:serine/threonine protein phosphatase 1
LGRTLAIGDIHGCIVALRTLAEYVPFETHDTVITLGDYVDRGPDSAGVLDWLIEREANCRLIAIRGNHDEMMLGARQFGGGSWVACGGDLTLESYKRDGQFGSVDDVPAAHWEFLESKSRLYYETESHLFTHGTPVSDVAIADQPAFALLWNFWDSPAPHCSGKVLVCGHSTQESGRPLSIGHAICIDTGAGSGGWLTCLDVETGEYWQADDDGRTRNGVL